MIDEVSGKKDGDILKSLFVHHGDVAIHVLESGTPSHKTPSLLVIGGLGSLPNAPSLCFRRWAATRSL